MTNKHEELVEKRNELEGAIKAAAALNSDNPAERNNYYELAAQVAAGAPFNLAVNDTTPARVLNEIHAFNLMEKTDALNNHYSNNKAAIIQDAPVKGLENLVLAIPGKKIDGNERHNRALKAEEEFKKYLAIFTDLRSGEVKEEQVRGEILPAVEKRVKEAAEGIEYLTDNTRKLAVAIARDIVSTTQGAAMVEIVRLFADAKEAYEGSFDDKHKVIDYARNKIGLTDDRVVQDLIYRAGDENVINGDRDEVYLGMLREMKKALARRAA